jgi:hypothetical protein
MNIFVLDEDPAKAARDLCNKHVVKMLIESAQILSTVYRLAMEERENLPAKDAEMYSRLYKATHIHHPVTQWVRSSIHNTDWLWQHLLAIESEYNARYNPRREKQHKAGAVIRALSGHRLKGHGDWRFHTPFVQCMPEQYQSQDDAVTAYRAFYRGEKARFAKWQPHAAEPSWWAALPAFAKIYSNTLEPIHRGRD